MSVRPRSLPALVAASFLAATISYAWPAPVAASGVCGDGVVEATSEECDPGGDLYVDGNPNLGSCTTGTDCFWESSCCKFNCQFVGQGASCFDGEECTVDDLCNQVGACVGDPVSPGTACDDGLFCTTVDACDAGGSCVGTGDPCAGGPECLDTCDEADLSCESPPGTPCGDGALTECTAPDTCDGEGACVANDAVAGTACGDASDTDCLNPDLCDGVGGCQSNDEPAGTPCGDPTDNECTDPDSCDAAGACLAHDAPAGASAGVTCADANECTEDLCDGGGGCANPALPAGAACGDPGDSECGSPDTCDAGGSCSANHEPAGVACGDAAATACTSPDACDGAGACLANDAPDGAVCEDGDFCTIDDVCAGGTCSGGVARSCGEDGDLCTHDYCDTQAAACVNVAEPKPFCHDAGIAQIIAINKDGTSRDRLKWKWIRGLPVELEQFGDPTSDTDLELCLYDNTDAGDGLTVTELRGRLRVPPGAGWQTIGSDRGYKYRDGTRAVGGVKLIVLKRGGSPRLGIKAERDNLVLPEPVVPFTGGSSKGRYFNLEPSFNAQLMSSTGECWTGDFITVKKNTARKFKSRRRGVVIK